ncbi:MAG: DUF4394 domain-containing protein [Gemmatimonadota bacterium]|nr:DUF4394 domain-containing protein [Gemmatimonadota bacterium]
MNRTSFLIPFLALGAACAESSNPSSLDMSAAPPELSAARKATRAGDGDLIYGLTADNSLISFRSGKPNRVLSNVAISGAAEGLIGLDFRPSDKIGTSDKIGLLYGVGVGGRIYTIDPGTGQATFVAQMTVVPAGSAFGVGFNPVADRLRIHSESNQNLRLPVESFAGAMPPIVAGATVVDGVLAYAAGDRNFGVDPSITATAYTNSNATATTTELYAIDSELDVLVELASPNNGMLTTVGSLGVNTGTAAGFDIVGTADGIAYAAFSDSPSGKSTLYSIDLDTGVATRLGLVAQGNSYLIGIAVAP